MSNPDESQGLYGYSGPYYNTTKLDGQVSVLTNSLYTWPGSTWKVSGLVRNQTRCSIRLTGVTARLLGSHGEVLATVSATTPVADLRPGEPAPFVAEAPQALPPVASIDWHADYTFESPPAPRLLIFDVAVNQSSLHGTRYDFAGTLTNAASAPVDVRVEIAWFNDANKVIYVDSAKVRYISHPIPDWDTIHMGSQEMDQFIYITTDPAIAATLSAATDYAIWGVSK